MQVAYVDSFLLGAEAVLSPLHALPYCILTRCHDVGTIITDFSNLSF